MKKIIKDLNNPILRLSLIIIFSFITLSGCVGKNIQGPKEAAPHIIETPSAKNNILLNVKPEMLPEGAQANLPSFDGDSFFVTLPASAQDSVSTKQVFKEVVLPILNAIGFERGRNAFSLPPDQGVKMPVANFKGLVENLASQYKNYNFPTRDKTQLIFDAALGKTEVTAEINQTLERGEGMSFNQLVADIERQEIQYPFQQVVEDIPIEHTLILANRWEGQSITSVRGTVIQNYIITNTKELSARTAVISAIKSLASVKGVEKVVTKKIKNGPYLILLPYGSDSEGKTLLRFSYRMLLRTVFKSEDSPFLLWLDAETGNILKLRPLYDNIKAEGKGYIRNPDIGTFDATFEVDPAVSGQYVLQKEGLSNRIDYGADGDPSNDLSIPDNTNGSSSLLANFDQLPINDVASSICAGGGNNGFEQVSLLAALDFYTKHMKNMGIFQPFPKLEGVSADPPDPFNPRIEIEGSGYCNAHASMRFGVCSGYYDSNCPDAINEALNWTHDKSMVAHEMGHNITARLTDARPSDWCGTGTCSIPRGWLVQAHDLADAWGTYFEFTNCIGGWVYKNRGGVDGGLNCTNHNEVGAAPRFLKVSTPFDPANVEDHFPEKPIAGLFAGGNYGNGQIGSAALWEIRLAMISKSLFGAVQFGRRFTNAMRNSGFRGQSDAAYHPGLYEIFWDLEMEMVDQWANAAPSFSSYGIHGGSHTTNKVTAGFARAGLFLIPLECIDGDPSTGKGIQCPIRRGGENGGDAVIDIKDNDPLDDPSYGGVVHPEEDYLEIGNTSPTFQVWTGPRYRLDVVNKVATFNNPAPCNNKFRVEVSTDKNFVSGTTIKSPWINVDTDPTTPSSPECYGTWTPSAPEWNALQAHSPLTLIYYRAITRGSSIRSRRISTRPGKLWSVPPPYAVLTLDGKPEY